MQFHLPKILFDFGAITRLGQELAWLGVKRPMLASDKGLKAAGAIDHVVKSNPGVDFFVYAEVPENPTADGVDAAAAAYRENRCDGFVALGGGSVIDTVKAAAACVVSGKPVAEFMGHPERINFVLAPIVTVPTTAGSGSEVSTGSGIHPTATTPAKGTASLMSIPRVAICDPDLTMTLPPRLTAATGIDALSHCIEGFLAKTHSPFIDGFVRDGMKRAFTHVERAYRDGSDREARANMLMAAVAGGAGIHKGLGPVHSFAGVFGDRGLHHGTLVAIAMPPALRLAEERVPEKMRDVADALGLEPRTRVSDAVASLNARLDLPKTLSSYGYGEISDFAAAVDATWQNRFNLTSPYAPTRAEIVRFVKEAVG
jgi:alcohol dehydrogenase class IV